MQCQKNRKNGTFACDDCPGLDETGMVDATKLVQAEPTPADHKSSRRAKRPLRCDYTKPTAEPAAEVLQTAVHKPGPAIEEASVATEKKQSKSKGHCPTCNRDDVQMLSKSKCARCYARIAAGKNPVTGMPAPAEQAPAPTPAPPPIQSVKLPVTVNVGLDPLLLIVDELEEIKLSCARRLVDAKDNADRIIIAGRIITALRGIEV